MDSVREVCQAPLQGLHLYQLSWLVYSSQQLCEILLRPHFLDEDTEAQRGKGLALGHMALPVTKPGLRPRRSASWPVWWWSFKLCSCVDRFIFRGVPPSSGFLCSLSLVLSADPRPHMPAKDPVLLFMPIFSAWALLPPNCPPVLTCPFISVWTAHPKPFWSPSWESASAFQPGSHGMWSLHILVTLREGTMLYPHIFHMGIILKLSVVE